MTSKRKHLDTNTHISDSFLNIKKIDKNSYKELEIISDREIDKNSEFGPTFDEKIGENSNKELKPTPAKKKEKDLNKKLRPSFIHNNIHLKKEAKIPITEANNKVYKQKTYNEAIADPIYDTR